MTGKIETDHVTILLDIKTELGSLNARMIEAGRSRQRMEDNIDTLTANVAAIKPVVTTVEVMEKKIVELVEFKARIGSYVWLGGAIAMGALTLLWQGLSFFSDGVKASLGRLFH